MIQRFNIQRNLLAIYTEEQADKMRQEKGYTFMEDAGRGYRRVVPLLNLLILLNLIVLKHSLNMARLSLQLVVAVSQLLRNKVVVIKVSMQSLIKIRQVHYLQLIYNRIN